MWKINSIISGIKIFDEALKIFCSVAADFEVNLISLCG